MLIWHAKMLACRLGRALKVVNIESGSRLAIRRAVIICLPRDNAVWTDVLSHGVQERLFDVSDAYRVHVCKDCGMLAVANLRTQTFTCRACKSYDSVVQVRSTHPLFRHAAFPAGGSLHGQLPSPGLHAFLGFDRVPASSTRSRPVVSIGV